MIHIYVYSFLAGIFGANGIPHFVKGITGQKHQTPFGRPSSAIVNVLWGWVNFAIAGLLLFFGQIHPHILRAFTLTAVGGLLMALLLAYTWSKHPENNKE
jgi:hypothetical protein